MIRRFLPLQPVTREGQLGSDEFLQVLQEMAREIEALQDKLDAIAAVTAPSGGATVDAEARTAIAAIIAGAA